MAKAQEVESKLTISRPDHDQLLKKCHVVKRIDQLNVYFDEQWTLADAGATCRVRCASDESPTFTLKVPLAWEEDGTRRSIEIEAPVHAACAQFSLFLMALDSEHFAPEVKGVLRQLNVSTLRRVGRMRNIRQVLRLPSGKTFELDSFSLPDGEHCFEVEVEEENDLKRRAIVSEILKLIPEAHPSQVSKFQRFTEAARRSSNKKPDKSALGSRRSTAVAGESR
jgi:uncharacterized protein YjbK